MPQSELERVLRLSRALLITSFLLALPLFVLLIKTVEYGEDFLDNSNKMLQLVQRYKRQQDSDRAPLDVALLIDEAVLQVKQAPTLPKLGRRTKPEPNKAGPGPW